MISRHVSVDHRDRVAAEAHGAGAGSPWAAEDLVDPAGPGVGRYGDAQWVFPSDRASGRPWRIDFGRPGEAFPTADWLVVARDLVMALYGRCPGRSGLARSGSKPVTVMLATRKLGVVARWAHAAGHGLPHEWTRATIGAFVVAYHDSRLPIRVSETNPKSQATTGLTLATYLNLIAALHEHRHQLASAMTITPWEGWPAVGAFQLAGVDYDDECRTAIVEPEVWWAAVRAALRILNIYAPTIIGGWHALQGAAHRPTLPWSAGGQGRFEAWAARPGTRVPILADRRPHWPTVAAQCGVTASWKSRMPKAAHAVLGAKVARGQTTRMWWATPQSVNQPDGTLSPWICRMDSDTVWELVAVLRNACLVVLAALSAMRVSELMELRRGCAHFRDGAWALRSTIQKGQPVPKPAAWWVTPMAVQAVEALEALVEPIAVSAVDPATGAEVASDHLICTLGRKGQFGRAGLAITNGAPFDHFVDWVDSHAEEFGFDRIGEPITAHQYRRTFAVVAAWQPDGHVAVELQLKDTAEVAAGYYANRDRRWFEAYEFTKSEALGARLAGYVTNHTSPLLAGPAGPAFAAGLVAADSAAHVAEGLDALGRLDAQRQALLAVGGAHACGDGWDCAGDRRHARCLAVAATRIHDQRPGALSTPQLTSGLCLDLGDGNDRACRNVIFDPATHLAFWDVEAARLGAAVASCDENQPLQQDRLIQERAGAHATIAEMEALCQRAPLRLLARFQAERLRLLERIADDHHAPGVAAIYGPLAVAQEARIDWLRRRAAQDVK